MTRDELQQKAADILKRDKRLVCMWATRVGKSNVVLKFLKDNPNSKTLILVPETNNIENWQFEFHKFNVPLNNVEIACYASYHKFEDSDWDLLVFDEAPHVNTDLKINICRSVRGKYILALGAVISDDELDTLNQLYGKFTISRITLSHAIQQGFVDPPTVWIMHLQLDDTKHLFLDSGKMCTAKEKYKRIEDKVSNAVLAYNTMSTNRNKLKMLRTGTERKRFLGEQKTSAIRAICKALESKHKRFLCFCSSISQADELGGECAFTSLSPAGMEHVKRFNNHEIDSLYVVGKLIEGQNLVDIDAGILGQLGGTERITVQEVGRVLRSENPVVYIPIFDGTKDESFLNTVTANIPAEYIKHYNFKYTF